jgi:glycosyltransferase involved in cell wall biosynthesis
MRILQLSNKAPYPANDGSSIAIYNLAEGLADNGVELHLLTINTKKHFKPDNQVPQAFKEKVHYTSVYQNTDTSVGGALANLCSGQSYFVSRFFFRAFEEEIVRKLKAHTFDLVQLEGVFLATYIPLIRKHSSAKIVIRAHNLEHQIWERHLVNEPSFIKKKYLSLQSKRLKRFELEAFANADAVVTITDEDKKNIQGLVPQKALYTCLTGINLDTYKHVESALEANTLFHFARWTGCRMRKRRAGFWKPFGQRF